MNKLTKYHDAITGKQQNILRLLQLINHRGPISQKDLSQLSGLQPSTTSTLLKELKKRELVIVAGKGKSKAQGGKKADLLQLNGAYGVFTGLYIKEEKICSCAIDLQDIISNYQEIALEDFSPSCISKTIAEIIREDEASYQNYRGAGIAVQSTVSPSGDIIMSPGLHLKLKEEIDSITPHLISVVENDVNCSACHFYNFYQGQYANFAAIMFYFKPFAMGSGIFINGNLYRGVNGTAGEIWRERTQGNTLEGILQKYNYSLKNIMRSTEKAVFIKCIREYILSIATLLDAEAVVLCGDLPGLGDVVLRELSHVISSECNAVAVEIAETSNSPIIGAAEIATEHFLSRHIQTLN